MLDNNCLDKNYKWIFFFIKMANGIRTQNFRMRRVCIHTTNDWLYANGTRAVRRVHTASTSRPVVTQLHVLKSWNMSPFPGHVSIVSCVDHVLYKENIDADRACADQKIAAVIGSTSCIYRMCGMQRRVAAFTKIGTRQVASTPRQTAAPEAGPVSREIFFMRFAA